MFVRRIGGSRGFTLLEALVVMLIVGLIVAFGLPALQQMINRSRLEGATRECAVVCQRARLEAIKQGVPVAVRFDTADRTVESWLDANGDGTQDPTEIEFVVMTLPGTIDYAAPAPQSPVDIENGENTDGDGGWITFFTDGSIDFTGNIHFGDTRGNFLQLSLGPRATGQTELSKWDDTGSGGVASAERGQTMEVVLMLSRTDRERAGRRGPSSQAGLSLIEATIAAALLLMIAAGVLPLFTQALANNLAGADSSSATNTARSRVEELFQLPFNHGELTLISGKELVTDSYYSLADHVWKPGLEPAGGVDPALWTRSATIRQYSVRALDDEIVDPAEALDFDADLGQVHFKEIETEVVGTRTAGPLGPSRRITVRMLKSQ